MRAFDVDAIFLNLPFPPPVQPPPILSFNTIMVSKRVKRKTATSGSATASSKAKGKAKATVMDAQRRAKPAVNGSARRSQRRTTAVASASSSKFRVPEDDSSETDSTQSEEFHDPSRCNCKPCSDTRYTWTVVAADIENQGLTPDDSVRLWSICPSEALWNRCMRLSQDLRRIRFQRGMSETEIGIVTKLAFGFQESQRS